MVLLLLLPHTSMLARRAGARPVHPILRLRACQSLDRQTPAFFVSTCGLKKLDDFQQPKLCLAPQFLTNRAPAEQSERVRYTATYAGMSRTTSVNLPELIS
jgi:hypothetical protein